MRWRDWLVLGSCFSVLAGYVWHGAPLIFAISRENLFKTSCNRRLGAGKSVSGRRPLGAINYHTVSLATSVPSALLIKIVSADRQIELKPVVFGDGCSLSAWTNFDLCVVNQPDAFHISHQLDSPKDLFEGNLDFLAAVQRELFHLREHVLVTHLIRDSWRIVKYGNADFLLQNELWKCCNKDAHGISLLNILDPYAHGSSMKVNSRIRDLTVDGTDKIRRSANYNLWPVLGGEVPFSLQVSPYGYAKVAKAAKGNSSANDNLYAFYWTRRLPASAKGFLLVLIGSLGTVAGFVWFFGLLVWDINSGRGILGSIGVIIVSTVVFHFGCGGYSLDSGSPYILW